MYNGILHHGTISVNTKLDILEQVLKPSELKLKAQGFPNLKERITTLSRETGSGVPIDAFKQKLIKGFERILKTNFTVGARARGKSKWQRNFTKRNTRSLNGFMQTENPVQRFFQVTRQPKA